MQESIFNIKNLQHVEAEKYADILRQLFIEKSQWHFNELSKKGIKDPRLIIKHPLVISYLGLRGLFVRIIAGKRLLAIALESGARSSKYNRTDETEAFIFPQKVTSLVRRAIELRLPVLVVGPTGTGKTTLIRLLATEINGIKPFAINLHTEMGVDDFYGTKELINGCTVFRPGPVLFAMQKQIPLLINELDATPPEILFCMQSLLEKGEVTLPMVNDETGQPMVINPWTESGAFTVCATANTCGHGDDTGLYRGTHFLNESFLDRFWIISLDYPEKNDEISILTQMGLDEKHARKIVEVATLARNAMREARSFNLTFGVRKVKRWAEGILFFRLNFNDAFCLAVLETANAEDRKALCEIYQRVMGKCVDLSYFDQR